MKGRRKEMRNGGERREKEGMEGRKGMKVKRGLRGEGRGRRITGTREEGSEEEGKGR